MKKLLKYMLVFLCVLLSSTSVLPLSLINFIPKVHATGVFFSDDFEAGHPVGWDWGNGTCTNTTAHTGTYSVNSTDFYPSSVDLTKNFPANITSVWATSWLKITNQSTCYFRSAIDDSDGLINYVSVDNTTEYWALNSYVSSPNVTSLLIELNVWINVTQFSDVSSGFQALYINGSLVATLDLTPSTLFPPLSSFMFSTFRPSPYDLAGVGQYVDDVSLMPTVATSPVEHVVNGGFETGDLTGWQGDASVVDSEAHNGTYSAQLGYVCHLFQTWSAGNEINSNLVNNFSCYMKCVGSVSPYFLEMYIDYNDSTYDGWSQFLTSGSWTYVNLSAHLTPNKFIFEISFFNYLDVWDDVYVDDVSLITGVVLPLAVTVSPSSATIAINETQPFSASLTGGTPSYSYTWFVNGTDQHVGSSEFDFQTADAGFYHIWCNVTDSANATAQSNIANCTVQGIPSLPTYSNVWVNSTAPGYPCKFSCLWQSNLGLSGHIFGTDNTGSWVNETWTPLSGTSAWANVTKTLTTSLQTLVQYQWWCNNSIDQWTTTGIKSLTTATRWSDGFESGNLSQWSVTYSGSYPQVVTKPIFQGVYACKFYTAIDDCYVYKSVNQPQLYWRAKYQIVSTNVDFLFPDEYATILSAYIQSYGGSDVGFAIRKVDGVVKLYAKAISGEYFIGNVILGAWYDLQIGVLFTEPNTWNVTWYISGVSVHNQVYDDPMFFFSPPNRVLVGLLFSQITPHTTLSYADNCKYDYEFISAAENEYPQIIEMGQNSTRISKPCKFYCKLTDDTGLSAYVFGTNNTGTWVNDTQVSLSGTFAWANVTKTLTSIGEITIGYQFWIKDVSDQWSTTGLITFETSYEWFFYDYFETGDLSRETGQWYGRFLNESSVNGTGDGFIRVAPEYARNGAYGMRAWAGSESQAYTYVQFTERNVIYVRFSVKIEYSTAFGHMNAYPIAQLGNSAYGRPYRYEGMVDKPIPSLWQLSVYDGSFEFKHAWWDLPSPPWSGGIYYDTSLDMPFEYGKWYDVVVGYKSGSGDGWCALWIDGVRRYYDNFHKYTLTYGVPNIVYLGVLHTSHWFGVNSSIFDDLRLYSEKPTFTTPISAVSTVSLPEGNAIFYVDGVPWATPVTLPLSEGVYNFTALESASFYGITYTFSHWIVNGTNTYYTPSIILMIKGDTVLTIVFPSFLGIPPYRPPEEAVAPPCQENFLLFIFALIILILTWAIGEYYKRQWVLLLPAIPELAWALWVVLNHIPCNEHWRWMILICAIAIIYSLYRYKTRRG